MEIAKTIKEVRRFVSAARLRIKRIGFVPTMGALHKGHVSLIEASAKNRDFVVVSIFVNPTQFGPGEDFNKYPRPIDADIKICKENNVNLVFVPTQKEVYGSENLTWVNVERITDALCGQFRPGHFRGVTTVCTKLFNIVQPDVAYFGQKDAQQAMVIRRMVADLNMPLQIVVCPTVREHDGLAISSRNQYLTPQQKKDATCIYRALQKCRYMVEAGSRDSKEICAEMHKILSEARSIDEIQDVTLVDAETLQLVEKAAGIILAAVAVKMGTTRLIDNILLDVGRS